MHRSANVCGWHSVCSPWRPPSQPSSAVVAACVACSCDRRRFAWRHAWRRSHTSDVGMDNDVRNGWSVAASDGDGASWHVEGSRCGDAVCGSKGRGNRRPAADDADHRSGRRRRPETVRFHIVSCAHRTYAARTPILFFARHATGGQTVLVTAAADAGDVKLCAFARPIPCEATMFLLMTLGSAGSYFGLAFDSSMYSGHCRYLVFCRAGRGACSIGRTRRRTASCTRRSCTPPPTPATWTRRCGEILVFPLVMSTCSLFCSHAGCRQRRRPGRDTAVRSPFSVTCTQRLSIPTTVDVVGVGVDE